MPIDKSYIFENPFIRITKTCYADGVVMKPHTHTQTAISMILSGSNHETVYDKTCLGGIANMVIKPAGIKHNNLFSDNCTILSLYLKSEKAHKIFKEDILKEWNWIHSNSCYHFLSLLMECANEKEYYQHLNNFLRDLASQKISDDFIPIPKWIVDVKNYLDLNYSEIIRSKDLAAEFKVHPVYLSRVFRKYFGQSIKSYLKILRINGCMAAIIHEDDILAQIALKNGFSDQSHLNRNFKQATGFTPYQFKNLIQ